MTVEREGDGPGLRDDSGLDDLPAPLRAAEAEYLGLRDTYLAGVGERMQAEADQARALRDGDVEACRSATQRLGALGSMGDFRERVRRTGEHAYGLAFRMAMRRSVPADVVRAVEAEATAHAGTPPCELPDLAPSDPIDGRLAYPSLDSWKAAIEAERRALSEGSPDGPVPASDVAHRLRAIASLTADMEGRIASAPLDTMEILVPSVARRMMGRDEYQALKSLAAALLGRPATELPQAKGRGRPGRGERPLDMRHLAGDTAGDGSTRHRGRRTGRTPSPYLAGHDRSRTNEA